MERFAVKRGLVKQVTADGGLGKLAQDFFDNVTPAGENAFTGSHGIMSNIKAHYEGDALITDVVNDRPNFDDRDAMKAAQDDRRKFTTFLDVATGYTSKQRGDKAKEWVKKASKAKSAISGALHFMSMAKSMSDEKREKAEGLIAEIEAALEAGDNTKAAGRGEKLSKMLNE